MQRISLPELVITGESRIEENPGDIVRTNGVVLVSHFDLKRAARTDLTPEAKRASLAFVDDAALARGETTAQLVATCVAPHGIVTTADKAYVACYGEDSIATVDLATKSVLSRTPLAGAAALGGTPVIGPYALALRPPPGPANNGAASALLVASTESKDLRFFDLATNAETPPLVAFEGAPYFPTEDAQGRIFVPTQSPDALVVVDGSTHVVLSTNDLTGVCATPHEAVLSKDQQTIYLVCEGDHVSSGVIVALETMHFTKLWATPVGVYPDRLVVWRAP